MSRIVEDPDFLPAVIVGSQEITLLGLDPEDYFYMSDPMIAYELMLPPHRRVIAYDPVRDKYIKKSSGKLVHIVNLKEYHND